jgi:hypothetical protein
MSIKEQQQQEDRIQQEMVVDYNNTYCLTTHPHRSLIFHVPNQNQQHLASIGVLGGVSDLIVLHRAVSTHKALHIYIEVKTPTGSQSPKQVAFQQRIEALGYEYYVVRTLQEFQQLIERIHRRELAKPSTMPFLTT